MFKPLTADFEEKTVPDTERGAHGTTIAALSRPRFPASFKPSATFTSTFHASTAEKQKKEEAVKAAQQKAIEVVVSGLAKPKAQLKLPMLRTIMMVRCVFMLLVQPFRVAFKIVFSFCVCFFSLTAKTLP